MIRFLVCMLVLVCISGQTTSGNTDPYDWTSEVTNGDDLKITLGNEKEKIVVTLWLENIYHEWEQNKKNQRVKGTVKNLIAQCHPNTVYTEADTSDYNINAFTFEEQAKYWGVDLRVLNEGPIVMAVYQQTGQYWWGSNSTQTISLARALDSYLTQIEQESFGTEPSSCDIDLIFKEVNEYDVHDPWQPYGHYEPNKMDQHHIDRLEREGKAVPEKKKPKISLKEPDKVQQD